MLGFDTAPGDLDLLVHPDYFQQAFVLMLIYIYIYIFKYFLEFFYFLFS